MDEIIKIFQLFAVGIEIYIVISNYHKVPREIMHYKSMQYHDLRF